MSGSSGNDNFRTIHQIVDEDGKPAMAAHTEPLWVDRTATNVFSFPTAGNKIKPFTTGSAYFDDLIEVCKSATSEICIAGWQVNWDALLNKEGMRLYDLLYLCACNSVDIYIMPWNDTEPVQTYDDQTKTVLESINSRIRKKGISKKVHVMLSSSMAERNNAYFSHHQKQVVVDRKIAYVGGIDLAYGRMDDEHYDLKPDSHGRMVLNRYNPCIPPVGIIKKNDSKIVDPDLMKGAVDVTPVVTPYSNQTIDSSKKTVEDRLLAGGWQVRYAGAGTADVLANSGSFSSNVPVHLELDPDLQPRMPWQDVHCRIEGPAVSDLLRNFILRWNCTSKTSLKLPKNASEYPREGNASIQVLRSASALHCKTEIDKNGLKQRQGTQTDIYVGMKNMIAKARRFIYIENQFFVSDFGVLGGDTLALSPAGQYIKEGTSGIPDSTLKLVRFASKGDNIEMDQLPRNTILKSLLSRFKEVIVDDVTKPPFHLYVTVPVHPEGSVLDASIAVQVYFTMQTLVFGSHSLINGLKRLIKARELKDKKDPKYLDVINNVSNKQYESVSLDQCYEYVTLLNLRNWAQLKKNYVTEQIYVHSKLMIVDDRFAILGSANINDRSMLGERDSELAVMVMDDDVTRADINGKGSNQPVRIFAHELRVKIWNKLFGIGLGARAAELKQAIEAPGNPDSWKLIQRQAKKNAELYEAAFPYIPRNFSKDGQGDMVNSAIIPTWDPAAPAPKGAKWLRGNILSPLPSQTNFWNSPRYSAAVKDLVKVKGFFSALPVEWTHGENIWIKYPTAIIVNNEKNNDVLENKSNEILLATNDNELETKEKYES